jgi:hypothetical protein
MGTKEGRAQKIQVYKEKDEIEARPGAFNDSPRGRTGYTQAAHVSCRQRYPGPQGILARAGVPPPRHREGKAMPPSYYAEQH